jgi:L-rhamnose mutarotase
MAAAHDVVNNVVTFHRHYVSASEGWRLMICKGEYFAAYTGSEMWTHVPRDSPWLARDWVWVSSTNTWTYVQDLRSLPRDFDDIAFGLLPHWDEHIHCNFSKATRKGWSHVGVTSRYGDPGNLTYYTLFRVCMALRRRMGAAKLWYLEYMNQESIGDIFEAVLGFPQDARLHGAALQIWPQYAQAVDRATIAVYESFSLSVDLLFDVLELDDVIIRRQLRLEERKQRWNREMRTSLALTICAHRLDEFGINVSVLQPIGRDDLLCMLYSFLKAVR